MAHKITVVTTFNKKGLDEYGQRFIDSFEKNVDPQITLLVYAEDCYPDYNSNQTIVYSLNSVKKLAAFKEEWKDVPKANGIPPDDIKARRPRDWHKKFKWDAVRFAHKVFAIDDAIAKGTDWLVWMDADTVVHSPITLEEFAELLPNDKWLTYVGRGKGSQTWPECGFYGMNLKSGTCRSFLNAFVEYYVQAESGIFTLEEWHDSYVFGFLLDQYKHNNQNVLDYSADIYNKTAKTGGGGHPLINTVLGKWFDHLKGNRKQLGHSKKTDLLSQRDETYWNEI